MRYEDLKEDTVSKLIDILRFIEIERTEKQIESAVQRASFDSLRKIEETKGFNLEQLKNVKFVRKGKSGGWREYFTESDLVDFNKYHGGSVPELGYIWE